MRPIAGHAVPLGAPARIDLAADPPDPRLVDAVGGARCIREGFVPWRRVGGATVLASARGHVLRQALPAELGPCRVARTTEHEVARAISTLRDRQMARAAEALVPARLSARSARPIAATIGLALGTAAMLIWLGPIGVVLALTGLTILTLVLSSALRLAALVIRLHRLRDRPTAMHARLPVVSVLLPLYDEPQILPSLVARLAALDYPADRLDVILVVEEEDVATHGALKRLDMPPWLRSVSVPGGPVRTKPRALNYALPFARGSIIGIWDAEDAPEPDQLRRIAARFAAAPPEVVCLQGILDFYNPRRNWLSRCFAIEYAAWFRVILPGLERMGLAVPLGGTTVFFRRSALDALGGWDAHNVTEDADLGIRIARAGWRTEIIRTVTYEEANCAVRPWIVQRSRWLKGYAVTWAVHMRNPVALWRDLGPWQFAGVQVLFLCTLTQFLLAPLTWGFWMIALALPHLTGAGLGETGGLIVGILLFGSEVLLFCISAIAVRGTGHRRLVPWVPTLLMYYPLATIAAWRGVLEIATHPFHWHKTAHGAFSAPVAEARGHA